LPVWEFTIRSHFDSHCSSRGDLQSSRSGQATVHFELPNHGMPIGCHDGGCQALFGVETNGNASPRRLLIRDADCQVMG
jgi:hypothetical protein